MAKTFTVIFYQGGSEAGQWRRTLGTYASKPAALTAAEGIMRAGRPALVNETRFWDTIGLPEGAPQWWDFTTLRPRGA